jgi:hypothetical protein
VFDWYWPAGQLEQSVAPELGWNFPVGHDAHAAACAVENFPTTHTVQLAAAEEPVEKVPAVHEMQLVVCGAAAYVPVGQFAHAVGLGYPFVE